jgi:hypothetical protein
MGNRTAEPPKKRRESQLLSTLCSACAAGSIACLIWQKQHAHEALRILFRLRCRMPSHLRCMEQWCVQCPAPLLLLDAVFVMAWACMPAACRMPASRVVVARGLALGGPSSTSMSCSPSPSTPSCWLLSTREGAESTLLRPASELRPCCPTSVLAMPKVEPLV